MALARHTVSSLRPLTCNTCTGTARLNPLARGTFTLENWGSTDISRHWVNSLLLVLLRTPVYSRCCAVLDEEAYLGLPCPTLQRWIAPASSLRPSSSCSHIPTCPCFMRAMARPSQVGFN